MKRNRVIAIVVGAAVLIGIGLYIYGSNTKKKRFDWYENYRSENKQPYGTYVTAELLKKYFSGKKFETIKKPVDRALPKDAKNHIYVFIGGYAFYGEKGKAELLNFVKKGNTVFISSLSTPEFILDRFAKSDSARYRSAYADIYKKTVTLNFTSPKAFADPKGYTCYHKFIDTVYQENWEHIRTELRNADTLGTVERKFPNFVRVRYGKGYFYLHSTPLIFTNYHARREQTAAYLEKVFSYLPEGNIYWDEFSRTPYDYADSPDTPNETPLAYIFSQLGLRAAWYALLALTLLYLVFTAKRRQRIIPVLEENNNTSLEFAETIGQLYLSRRNHKKLLELKMKIFTEFIRSRYRLVYKDITEEFIKKLSVKAQVPLEETAEIFKIYANQQYEFQIPAETVIRFHNATENFRKKCK